MVFRTELLLEKIIAMFEAFAVQDHGLKKKKIEPLTFKVSVTQMYNKCTAEYMTDNRWIMRMYKTKIMKEKKKLKMITCKI